MAKKPVDPESQHAEAVADAKRLMRLARLGALASLEPETGAPLTTLVGVASDFDGAPLFLMSTLSRHTRDLAHDPRASLLLTGSHDRGDPLNHARVTLGGRIDCGQNQFVRSLLEEICGQVGLNGVRGVRGLEYAAAIARGVVQCGVLKKQCAAPVDFHLKA